MQIDRDGVVRELHTSEREVGDAGVVDHGVVAVRRGLDDRCGPGFDVHDPQELRDVDVLGRESAAQDVVARRHELDSEPRLVGVEHAGGGEQGVTAPEHDEVHEERDVEAAVPRKVGCRGPQHRDLVCEVTGLRRVRRRGIQGRGELCDVVGCCLGERPREGRAEHLLVTSSVAAGEKRVEAIERSPAARRPQCTRCARQQREQLPRLRDGPEADERAELVAQRDDDLGLVVVVAVEPVVGVAGDTGGLLPRESGFGFGLRRMRLDRQRRPRREELQEERQRRLAEGRERGIQRLPVHTSG